MTSDVEPAPKKVWSVGQIGALTLFGGPFAGTFLLSKNYRVFENPSAAKKILQLGAVSTALLFILFGLLPEALLEKLPNYSIPVAYIVIMIQYAKKHQKALIVEHLKTGEKHSHWKAFGFCLAFMPLAFAWGMGVVFLVTSIKDLIFGS